uniref:Uncharacterized protein n=1 Tax=Arundo donax TaxID=35708 RepID=A0A0A9GI45_ARUDO
MSHLMVFINFAIGFLFIYIFMCCYCENLRTYLEEILLRY